MHGHVEAGLNKLSQLILSPGAHGPLTVDVIRLIADEVLGDRFGMVGWLTQTATHSTLLGHPDEEDRICFSGISVSKYLSTERVSSIVWNRSMNLLLQ